jgi:hypothetical protein
MTAVVVVESQQYGQLVAAGQLQHPVEPIKITGSEVAFEWGVHEESQGVEPNLPGFAEIFFDESQVEFVFIPHVPGPVEVTLVIDAEDEEGLPIWAGQVRGGFSDDLEGSGCTAFFEVAFVIYEGVDGDGWLVVRYWPLRCAGGNFARSRLGYFFRQCGDRGCCFHLATAGDVVLSRVLLDPGQPLVEFGLVSLHARDVVGVEVGRKRRRGRLSADLDRRFVDVG